MVIGQRFDIGLIYHCFHSGLCLFSWHKTNTMHGVIEAVWVTLENGIPLLDQANQQGQSAQLTMTSHTFLLNKEAKMAVWSTNLQPLAFKMVLC